MAQETSLAPIETARAHPFFTLGAALAVGATGLALIRRDKSRDDDYEEEEAQADRPKKSGLGSKIWSGLKTIAVGIALRKVQRVLLRQAGTKQLT